ncbi:MAG: LacI family transcriptional regulator [Anaerolineae bacterium]|nr:LacI family transcriptional regulator [Anaerolineae bacterium]
MAKVTIGDVAEYAQVSRATVSRVLNGNDTVDDHLRARVLEAVRALNYTPNRMARRLRKESHDVIGLIVSDIQNPHFVSVIKGVEETAYVNDMNLLLCSTGEDSGRLAKYAEVMRAESVAGLIAVPTSDDDARTFATLREYNIPIVILDRVIEGFEADVVRSDNEGGAYQLTRHLLNFGYRRIAIVYPNLRTGFERYTGYAEALREYNIAIDPTLAKSVGYHIEDGYRYTRELLTSPHRPEVIFTATNLLTIGALRALREFKIRVPHDVALVGFDDLPWGDEFAVPVTVAAQHTYDLGKTAVEVLIRRLENPDLPYVRHNLETTLIVRESCGTKKRSP